MTRLLLVCAISCFATLLTGASAAVNCSNITSATLAPKAELPQVLEQYETALILLLGFGSLSVFLAFLYIGIRKYVYDDTNNLDSTFDAGGNVSMSLTAVTIAAQLLWPGDLMQSVTIAVKYGIAGGFWYCSAALVNLSLFPLLSFKFKTRAPGAKTYLQIVLARFGRPAHTVYCFFALLMNLVVLSTLLAGGIATIQAVVIDASTEFCVLILVTLCGSYTFIGGLGSTFYVSYFNAVTTFVLLAVLVFRVFYSDDPPFGTLEEIYDKVNCLPKLEGNRGGSYFTFLSEGAGIFAIQGIFLVTSITYCDQASWQSRIAAKPLQGSLGFLLGSAVWFAVPATIAITTGFTYLAISTEGPENVLSTEQINSGIISTFMSQKALGKQGSIMMLTMLTMLTMSTGSGEIMAVSSIIVYDIYQIYLRPFRPKITTAQCILCGLMKEDREYAAIVERRRSMQTQSSVVGINSHIAQEKVCICPDLSQCEGCKEDKLIEKNAAKEEGNIFTYTCQYHGKYKRYQQSLVQFKDWCILWVTIFLVPFGLVIISAGIDLNWTMMVGAIFTVPSFPGVIVSVLWCKTTGKALIIGTLSGLVCGVVANAAVAYGYYEGDGGFIIATAEPYAVVAGSVTGLFISLILIVVISLCTHNIKTEQDEAIEWQKLRDIDNPLHPWAKQFAEDFPELTDGTKRPTYEELDKVTSSGKKASIIGSIIFFLIFILLIPGVMASLEVLSFSEFKGWVTFLNVWCIVMAIIIVTVTPVEEVRAIFKQILSKRRKKAQSEPDTSYLPNGSRMTTL